MNKLKCPCSGTDPELLALHHLSAFRHTSSAICRVSMEAISCVSRKVPIGEYRGDANFHLKRFKSIVSYLTHPKGRSAYCASSKLKVFSWGSGLQAQLGHGDYVNQPLPKTIEYLTQCLSMDDAIRQCSCGSFHTGCTTERGKLFTWGRTQDNRLGHGDDQSSADQSLPKDIAVLDQCKIIKVCCGDSHTFAITNDGRLLSWGKNNHGQCGRPSRLTLVSPPFFGLVKTKCHSNPPPASSSAKSDYVPVSSSLFARRSTPPSTEQKDPWTHRLQSTTSLAVGFVEGLPSNTYIQDHELILCQVCCGKFHSMALSSDGIVYVWGSNGEGALGLGDELMGPNAVDHIIPMKIDQNSFNGKKVTRIAAGFHFSAAVTEDGKLYTWGSDQYGQLGNGKESRRVPKPYEVRSLGQYKIKDISCGQYHMAAVTEAGDIFTWGYGKDGQLGHGERTDVSIPTRIDQLGTGNHSVSCGGGNTAVIDSNSMIWIMGKGREGQLGRADNVESIVANRLEPVLVEFFKTTQLQVKSVSLGQEHSIAIVSEA